MGTEGQCPWDSPPFLSRCLLDPNCRLYSLRPHSTRTPCSPPHPPACSPSVSKTSSLPTPSSLYRLPSYAGVPRQLSGPVWITCVLLPKHRTRHTHPTQGTWTSMLCLLRVFSEPQCIPHSNHKPSCALDRAKETSLQGVWVRGGVRGWLGHRQT